MNDDLTLAMAGYQTLRRFFPPARGSASRGRAVRLGVLIAGAALVAGLACAGQDRAALAVPHVRGVDPLAREVLEAAAARSPAVAAMIASLQQSDVIVIVGTGVLLAPKVKGVAHVLACGPGVRYVRVLLRIPNHKGDLMRVLGHELQHALEIAAMPEIRDGAGLERAYREIGIRTGRDNYFETEAAVRAGRRVARELEGRVR